MEASNASAMTPQLRFTASAPPAAETYFCAAGTPRSSVAWNARVAATRRFSKASSDLPSSLFLFIARANVDTAPAKAHARSSPGSPGAAASFAKASHASAAHVAFSAVPTELGCVGTISVASGPEETFDPST